MLVDFKSGLCILETGTNIFIAFLFSICDTRYAYIYLSVVLLFISYTETNIIDLESFSLFFVHRKRHSIFILTTSLLTFLLFE